MLRARWSTSLHVSYLAAFVRQTIPRTPYHSPQTPTAEQEDCPFNGIMSLTKSLWCRGVASDALYLLPQ